MPSFIFMIYFSIHFFLSFIFPSILFLLYFSLYSLFQTLSILLFLIFSFLVSLYFPNHHHHIFISFIEDFCIFIFYFLYFLLLSFSPKINEKIIISCFIHDRLSNISFTWVFVSQADFLFFPSYMLFIHLFILSFQYPFFFP